MSAEVPGDYRVEDRAPAFREIDLRDILFNGILMAANEDFFWPLGLALTVRMHEDGRVSELHVREWDFGDGHHESIRVDLDDPVVIERREAFENWLTQRLASMPETEAAYAEALIRREAPRL